METKKATEASTEAEVTTFYCNNCRNDVDEKEKLQDPENSSGYVCVTCFEEDYFECYDCSETFHRDNRCYDDRENYICMNCYDDNYFTCQNCESTTHNDNGYHGICNRCHEEEEREYNGLDDFGRAYGKGDENVTPGKRAYSAEIECYIKQYNELEAVSKAISPAVGISGDGSLEDNGVEFQTPKLSGSKGDKVLRDLCNALADNNASVDRTCGLHIHLDTSDFTGREDLIKKTFLFYLAFEPVIFSYLPMSRRKNTYCLPLSEFYHQKEIENAYGIEELEKIWYREQNIERIEDRKKEKYDGSRYAGINFHSMLSNGHLEIRYHSGTINYQKIKHWAYLHIAILNAIKSGRIYMDTLQNIKYLLTISEKQAKMFELLQLPKYLQNYFAQRAEKFGLCTKENELICAE